MTFTTYKYSRKPFKQRYKTEQRTSESCKACNENYSQQTLISSKYATNSPFILRKPNYSLQKVRRIRKGYHYQCKLVVISNVNLNLVFYNLHFSNLNNIRRYLRDIGTNYPTIESNSPGVPITQSGRCFHPSGSAPL